MFPTGARLQVLGEGFRQGAVVKWDSASLATTFESETSLTAMVPESLLRTPANVVVKVVNPDGQESNVTPVTVVVPTPVLARLTPQTVVAGGSSLNLTVEGTGFYAGARVRWNGEALETVIAGPTEARAVVPAARIATAGTAQVAVANTPAGPFSNAATFTILTAGDGLSISRLVPSEANSLIPEYPLKVTGAGFVPGSVVRWNGAPLATTFANSTEVNAAVPPTINTVPGAVSIVVVNPDGKQSNPASFTALPAVPTITSMTPSSRMWGAPPFPLEIRGHGFAPGAIIVWGSGGPLLTKYGGFDRLTAVAPDGGSASEVRVSVLNPGGPTGATQVFQFISWTFAGCSPSSAVAGGPSFSLTATGQNFQRGAVVRWSGTALETTFVDATTLVATVPASLIAAPGVAPVTVVQPDGAVSSPIYYTIRAGGSPTITIAPGGIVNAASAEAAIAPGSLISIYGSNLPSGAAFAETTPLPAQLNGVAVFINGIRAPLLFAGGSQVNAQVPYEISPGPATFVLNVGGTASESARVEVTATGPGIFQMPSGKHAVAQNAADYSLNSAEHPARSGEYVILYVVGQGRVDPAVATGAAATGSPLSYPVAPVSATVGGRTATVAFAGLAPGMVGVLQVNLRVPEGVSGDVPVEITVGGATTPAAILSVAGN
jgi:uncharacterized protein (TIGR03437 family)